MASKNIFSVNSPFSPFPEFGGKVQQAVLPIVTIIGDRLLPLGTGFIISPSGLMMTAKHVIVEAIGKAGLNQITTGRQKLATPLYALYLTNEPLSAPELPEGFQTATFGGMWPILEASFNESLDIAYCWLAGSTRNGTRMPLPTLRLTVAMPSVGEPIAAVGYYKMTGGKLEENAVATVASYAQETALSGGVVVEVHPLRRDSVMLSFPCFEVDARFDAGMSGGPVCNSKGDVCGVVCSSIDTCDGAYTSYASLVWPSLATIL